jgi:hypothetical protein
MWIPLPSDGKGAIDGGEAINRDSDFAYGTRTASSPVEPTGESIILHSTVG